ncbi:MAG: DNA alkylation repair protein [Isosphaeraceae bacterium]
MTAEEIVEELRTLGSESIKKVLRNHGVEEPFFGVKIGDMKKIQKRIKKDYQLALDLYDTGNYDAMYLAGLVADDARMTKKDLNRWAKMAKGGALATATVPWVAAGSRHGYEVALEWIESNKENVAVAGWATLSSLVALKDDEDLDLDGLKRLLRRVLETIHQQPDEVRHAMNGFLIALGTYVKGLSDLAEEAAVKVGQVSVDMGNTACKVPNALEQIQKARESAAVGNKRKTVKC